MWGLLIPYPSINGTWGLSGPDWYDESMRQRVRRLAKKDPNLGKEFHDRVLLNGDRLYLRKFISDVKTMEDP